MFPIFSPILTDPCPDSIFIKNTKKVGDIMRISTRGRYSLEALLYLALLPEGAYASTRTISENTGISDGYLEQLFIPLKKTGLIRGIRGAQGGYLPGKPPADILVGDILRSVEGSLAPVSCLSEGVCRDTPFCVTHATWGQIFREITACVDSISLKDLVDAYVEMDRQEYAI
jgi:Rrf2 family protein